MFDIILMYNLKWKFFASCEYNNEAPNVLLLLPFVHYKSKIETSPEYYKGDFKEKLKQRVYCT